MKLPPKIDPRETLRRIPDRDRTLVCERCGAIKIGKDQITGGGFLEYCDWNYEQSRWIVVRLRCHCHVGATNYPDLSLYDDARWAHPADDAEICGLRALEVRTGKTRFEIWQEGRKFVSDRRVGKYEPVQDPRGLRWFDGPPDPSWQNPDWKGDPDE